MATNKGEQRLILIGLIGPNGSGKSTIAMRAATQYRCLPQAFGDGLKRHCVKVYPEIPESEFGWTGKDWTGPKTARARKITHAESMNERKKNPMVWIEKIQLSDSTIIQDLRFQNEIEWVLMRGGSLIVLDGDKAPNNYPCEMEWRAWCHDNSPYVHTREEAWRAVESILNASVGNVENN